MGIVNLKEANVETLDHADMTTLFTYGMQSENNDALCMALLISKEHFLSATKAPTLGDGITNTELVYLTHQSNKYEYHFYAGWEKEEAEFSNVEFFRNSLKKEMQELAAEIEVIVE